MVNFDNAATTFPKPDSVRAAVTAAITKYGGNPGRSGHDISIAAAQEVYNARKKAADFFGAQPENVVLTLNCTHALNFAIKGVVHSGEHVIISNMEHNSVFRPVYALSKRGGVTYSIAAVAPEKDVLLRNIEKAVTPRTTAVIFTLGSNVTGQLMPYREIGAFCRRRGLCFIADGAQVCGVRDVDLTRDNINILCCAAHKGMYAAPGTGLLISDGKYKIRPIIEGGTGSTSLDPEQPDFLPDSLESGTVNTIGAISLAAGLDFVNSIGKDKIYAHEKSLCDRLIARLRRIDGVTVYRQEGAEYLPIVLFNISGALPEEACRFFNDKGFALRGGLHCSGLAHEAIGTLPDGAVRFAPSVFNTAAETERFAKAVSEAAKKFGKK